MHLVHSNHTQLVIFVFCNSFEYLDMLYRIVSLHLVAFRIISLFLNRLGFKVSKLALIYLYLFLDDCLVSIGCLLLVEIAK